ncbi:hypothetical protein Avbf_10856 [Armadillidium vulgare]|nr:hypothetical protein Avbf_10856 [Armadillidium vulgare]
MESHEELEDQKDHSSDNNLYYNQSTSSISTRNQVSDKSTQCFQNTNFEKCKYLMWYFEKNMSQLSAMSIPAILQENSVYEKIFTEKKAHIRYLKKKSAFLKLKLAAMKKEFKRKMTKADVIKYCTKKLPLLSLEVESCKSISLSIYLKSPRGYRYLRKVLKLPSVDTLKRYLNRVSIEPGLSNQLLMNFSSVTSKLKEIDKNSCTYD